MVKLLSFSILLCSLSSCQTPSSVLKPQTVRCISNINTCTKLLNEQSLEGLLRLDKELEELNLSNWTEYQSRVSVELSKQVALGNSKYLADGEFVFINEMIHLKNAGGVNKEDAYRVRHNNRSLFIKQFRTAPEGFLIRQVLYGKILFALGIGPKTDLVTINGTYYLVMDNLSGINIKETLYASHRLRNTKHKIDKMLGIKTQSVKESISLFARAILNSEDFMARLQEITNLLEQNGFDSAGDFQFMIDLKIGPSSLKVIDTDSLKRNGSTNFNQIDAPRNSMQNIINRLKDLAK